MRAIPEWIAKYDDQAIPERVKLRILRRENFVCFLSDTPIVDGDPVEFHHRIALRDGGEHRESNIYPVHRKQHKLETARQALARAAVDRKAKKAFGIRKAKQPFRGWRRFDGSPVWRSDVKGG
jgi:5-methylcytosine-specific restriction protein A